LILINLDARRQRLHSLHNPKYLSSASAGTLQHTQEPNCWNAVGRGREAGWSWRLDAGVKFAVAPS